MTVAGANQCRYPTEFDLEKKKHFLFKKKKKNVPWKKSVLILVFARILSSFI